MTVKRQDPALARLWGATAPEPPAHSSSAPPPPRVRIVEDPWLLLTRAFHSREPAAWDTERHLEAELLWSSAGNVTLEADGQLWLVPPSLGIWIPAGLPHRVRADSGVVTYATFITPDRAGIDWSSVTGVAMTAALRALLLHDLAHTGETAPRLRLQQVAIDLIEPVPASSLHIPMPAAPDLRDVARRIIDAPADDRTTAEWAAELGSSSRTLMRRFAADTGLSLTQWRILVRIRAAMVDIAAGEPVGSVAQRLGYANPSTFIELFRHVTGLTPAAYFRSVTPAG